MKNIILIMSLVLAGCTSNKVNPPKTPRSDPYGPSQIHVDSEELRKDTAVGVPVVGRDSAGLLVVTVPIRSTIDKFLYVDYYVTWFDHSGHPLAQRIGPRTITLDPNTPNSITVTSMSNKAEDFQIDFRYAR